mmetsp:Transcript_17665/g.47727  ORF Transcript_17665/g.47727 Transcript_17665/m.47727 type:complete len:200 (-) Transcript_17665:130-729(-)
MTLPFGCQAIRSLSLPITVFGHAVLLKTSLPSFKLNTRKDPLDVAAATNSPRGSKERQRTAPFLTCTRKSRRFDVSRSHTTSFPSSVAMPSCGSEGCQHRCLTGRVKRLTIRDLSMSTPFSGKGKIQTPWPLLFSMQSASHALSGDTAAAESSPRPAIREAHTLVAGATLASTHASFPSTPADRKVSPVTWTMSHAPPT